MRRLTIAACGSRNRRQLRPGREGAQTWADYISCDMEHEDKYALESADTNAKVPGIAFAEWGPGDMAFFTRCENGPGPMPALMQAARAKVLAATKASRIFFLNTVTPDNVVDMIKEGVMIGAGTQQAAEIGRKYSRREMPW